jgi:hypothetical protein
MRPDWAWGLSFLVTFFALFTGGVLMRAAQKIDECVFLLSPSLCGELRWWR